MGDLKTWYQRSAEEIKRKKAAVAETARQAWLRGEDLLEDAAKGLRDMGEAQLAAHQLRTAQQARAASSGEAPAARGSSRSPALRSICATAARGSEEGVAERLDLPKPGMAFTSLSEAANASLEAINPVSISGNTEYLYGYVKDNATGYFGYTDPYPIGVKGGESVVLRPTINGHPISNSTLIGMGHTYGNYTESSGLVARHKRDQLNSDKFSEPDFEFMRSNRQFDFYTLGTPSGEFLQYTRSGRVAPLPPSLTAGRTPP